MLFFIGSCKKWNVIGDLMYRFLKFCFLILLNMSVLKWENWVLMYKLVDVICWKVWIWLNCVCLEFVF